MQIDLGGIAKGYAADQALQILKKNKVRHALLNFSGTVIALGREQKIGIQHPYQKNGQSIAEVDRKSVV